MRSNYLSVCFFPQVIENIPLASLPASSKWVKSPSTREIYAVAAQIGAEIMTGDPLVKSGPP
jgi:hypothetical protein